VPAWIRGRVRIAERPTDASPTYRSKQTVDPASTGVPELTGALVPISAPVWIGGQIRIAERSRRRAVQSVDHAYTR
jgi:hypothetical protein